MFDYQTSSNIVWWSNILQFGHLVGWCSMVSDDVSSCLNSINHSIKQHQTFLLSSSFSSFGQVHETCLACPCEMYYRRFRHVEIVVVYSGWFCGPQLLAFGCLTMLDKTSLNRLARALDKEGTPLMIIRKWLQSCTIHNYVLLSWPQFLKGWRASSHG